MKKSSAGAGITEDLKARMRLILESESAQVRFVAQCKAIEKALDEARADPEKTPYLGKLCREFVREYHPEAMARDRSDPPKLAEFLLIAFAMTHRAAHAVGDLNERFACDCKTFGRDRAVRRYWAEALRSLWPLLKRAISKALRLGVLAAFRRLF